MVYVLDYLSMVLKQCNYFFFDIPLLWNHHLMKVSANWTKFHRLFVRAFGGQLVLDFPDRKEDNE